MKVADNKEAQMERDQNKIEGILHVQMLGGFVLRYNQNVLSGDKVRAKQVWNLLEYILANRRKEISLEKLMDVLWGEDEIENAPNALKNLAYRLRKVLNDTLKLPNGNYIVYNHGAYSWNQDIPCVIDTDVFENEYMAAAKQGISKELRKEHLQRAVQAYTGNFLPQSSFKDWVIPLAVYYQRIYMESVQRLSEILLEDEEYQKVEEICRYAIAVDPFIELNYVFLIRALIQSNNQKKALTEYQALVKLYSDELGVRPSDKITRLYEEIIENNNKLEKDISVIKKDLKEVSHIEGAIYCDYEIFKVIYRIEARAALRSGKSIFIALLTLTDKDIDDLKGHHVDNATQYIKDIILKSLRKDDVVSCYAKFQFLLMLSNITYESTVMVLNKLKVIINEACIGKKIEINCQLQSLDPVELESEVWEGC